MPAHDSSEGFPLLTHHRSNPAQKNGKSLRQFLSHLHYQLKIPLEMIETCISDLASVVSYYGSSASSVLALANGWQDERPKLIKPVLSGAFAPMLIGVLLNQLADITKHERIKKLKKDYRYFNDFFAEFTFMVRAVIMAYVIVASDFGKNNDEVDSSLETFLLLAGGSAIPPLISMIYKIYNNHSPIENKALQVLKAAADTLTFGAVIHDTTDLFPSINDTYTKRIGVDSAALIGGCIMAVINQRKPKGVEFLTEVLIATNLMFILTEFYKELEHDEKENKNQINALLMMWLIVLVLPVLNSMAIASYRHRHAVDKVERDKLTQIINEGYGHNSYTENNETDDMSNARLCQKIEDGKDNDQTPSQKNSLIKNYSLTLNLFSAFQKKASSPGDINSFANVLNFKNR